MHGEPIPDIFGLVKPTTLRGHYPRQNTSSIGLVNIRLSSIHPKNDPYPIVAHALAGWFTDESGLFKHEVKLNVNPEDGSSLEKHHTSLRRFVNLLRR
jgi:hypothetical protein